MITTIILSVYLTGWVLTAVCVTFFVVTDGADREAIKVILLLPWIWPFLLIVGIVEIVDELRAQRRDRPQPGKEETPP